MPLFNEEKCINELYSRIKSAAESIGVNFELICVNDCSTDSTRAVLIDIHKTDKRVKLLSFSRNFGHQIAITAGLNYASGDCVIVMDGDLQDPPEVTIEMFQKWREGFKVVYGIRCNRKENFFIKLCYAFFYRIFQKLSTVPIPLDAGDFCLMDRRVVKELRKFSEDRPFVRGLRSWVGFKQIGIEYDRPERQAGNTKYSFAKLVKLSTDGILSFSDTILRAAIIIGLSISFASLCYGVYIIGYYVLAKLNLVSLYIAAAGWTTLACLLTFLFGLLFIFIGIHGEYIGRIFLQTKGRPLYIVKEEIGFDDK